MKKLAHLRQHLINTVPDLHRNPDKLLTFIENGSIEFWQGTNLTHLYRFPARVILTDYSGDADAVVIPVLEWLQAHEPGMNPEDAIQFEAEIIDHKRIDLGLTIRITERVVVRDENGTRSVVHAIPVPEEPMNPDASWSVTDMVTGEATDNG